MLPIEMTGLGGTHLKECRAVNINGKLHKTHTVISGDSAHRLLIKKMVGPNTGHLFNIY